MKTTTVQSSISTDDAAFRRRRWPGGFEMLSSTRYQTPCRISSSTIWRFYTWKLSRFGAESVRNLWIMSRNKQVWLFLQRWCSECRKLPGRERLRWNKSNIGTEKTTSFHRQRSDWSVYVGVVQITVFGHMWLYNVTLNKLWGLLGWTDPVCFHLSEVLTCCLSWSVFMFTPNKHSKHVLTCLRGWRELFILILILAVQVRGNERESRGVDRELSMVLKLFSGRQLPSPGSYVKVEFGQK